eukprot:scaffold114715_cov63-Phaeocystis_antarctica.AAC.9
MAKVYVVGLDGSDIGYQALRLAAMVMNPEDDKIEVLHICLPGDDGEVATRLAHNAEIELRKAQVNPLRCTCTPTRAVASALLPPPPTAAATAAATTTAATTTAAAAMPSCHRNPLCHLTSTHPRDLPCDRRRRRMDSYRTADLRRQPPYQRQRGARHRRPRQWRRG